MQKIEGYWWSKYHTEYEVPVPDVLTEGQSEKIYSLIKEKEKSATRTLYRGFSISRIDNKTIVGSAEFSTDKWIWPDGFADHCVLKHKVKPSNEFLEYIGYGI